MNTKLVKSRGILSYWLLEAPQLTRISISYPVLLKSELRLARTTFTPRFLVVSAFMLSVEVFMPENDSN